MINPNYNKRCSDVAYDYDKGYSDGFRDAVEELKQACQSCKSRPEEFSRPFTAPEIVRCKDCKYATMTSDGKTCKYCEIDTDDDGYIRAVYHDADWFCADGERYEA